MSVLLPQTRPLSDTEAEGPAFKKQRIEISTPEQDASTVVEENPLEIVISLESVQNSGVQKPKKKKKRKDPPLPEPCSGADVLYQEIRELVGGDVVDKVTQAGSAFQSPFTFGEEVEVKIEMISSNGTLQSH